MFLVVIDAQSKWLEVHPMPTIVVQTTIQHPRAIITQLGVPERVVSDRRPTFISWELKNFWCQNGIDHVMSASYHPATNGLMERAVQTFKEGVKILKKGDMATFIDTPLIRN